MTGLASWYGNPYHGRRTSSGETYNMHDLTAAHPTLPFNTMVRVRNLENGKQVQVRVNERGPRAGVRAAMAIDLVGPGTARVSLKVLPDTDDSAPLAIQVGSFREYDNAVRLKEELEKRFTPVFIEEFDGPAGLYYRVLVGEFNGSIAASDTLQELKKAGYDGFIIRRE
jgi:rare lipoprotein A